MPFLLIKFLHLFLLCRDKCPYAFLKIILWSSKKGSFKSLIERILKSKYMSIYRSIGVGWWKSYTIDTLQADAIFKLYASKTFQNMLLIDIFWIILFLNIKSRPVWKCQCLRIQLYEMSQKNLKTYLIENVCRCQKSLELSLYLCSNIHKYL
jgi:hypothetical protein